jgi:hypothetical protein
MNTDDLGFQIDPALDERLRRTLHEVAATISGSDEVPARDGAGLWSVLRSNASVGPSRPDRRQRRSRFRSTRVGVLAGAAVAAIAAMALVFSANGPWTGRESPEAIALGDNALPPPMRAGGNVCLTGAREIGELGPDVRPTMVNFFEHDWLSVVIYQTGDRLIYCEVHWSSEGDEAPLGSVGGYGANTPLRGPIGLDLMSTEGAEGEYMAVAGRVSSRVGRVMFDDGAGHVRQARLANGTFATAGGYWTRDKALVISYDRAGKEIDRRRAFGTSCDPTYQGTDAALPGTTCGPLESWTPEATPHVQVG